MRHLLLNFLFLITAGQDQLRLGFGLHFMFPVFYDRFYTHKRESKRDLQRQEAATSDIFSGTRPIIKHITSLKIQTILKAET